MSPEQPLPTSDQFRFVHDIEVRFRDLDGMGHVNNAVFATYFETARIQYMRELGRLMARSADTPADQSFILLDLYCRYVDQVSYGEHMLVHVRTASIGGKSFQLDYLVTSRDGGRTVAFGHTTQVGFDYASGTTIVMPEEFRRAVTVFEGKGGNPARTEGTQGHLCSDGPTGDSSNRMGDAAAAGSERSGSSWSNAGRPSGR